MAYKVIDYKGQHIARAPKSIHDSTRGRGFRATKESKTAVVWDVIINGRKARTCPTQREARASIDRFILTGSVYY
jgi:hypothetical protein